MERRTALVACALLLLGAAGVLTPVVAVDFGASGYGAWYTSDSRAPVADPVETVRYESLTGDAEHALSVPWVLTDTSRRYPPPSPPGGITNHDARLSAAEWDRAEYLRANEHVRVRTDEWTRTYTYETAHLPFTLRDGHGPTGLAVRMGLGAVALALGARAVRSGSIAPRKLRDASRVAAAWAVGVGAALAIASQATSGSLPRLGPFVALGALFVAGAARDGHARLGALAVAVGLYLLPATRAGSVSLVFPAFAALAFGAGVVSAASNGASGSSEGNRRERPDSAEGPW